jgi:hypothetical protein
VSVAAEFVKTGVRRMLYNEQRYKDEISQKQKLKGRRAGCYFFSRPSPHFVSAAYAPRILLADSICCPLASGSSRIGHRHRWLGNVH